jgi:hypothetical protein
MSYKQTTYLSTIRAVISANNDVDMVHTWSCRLYHVYVIICRNDNFRYVPCLRHHLMKRQLQVCTMSTSLFADITARMVDKYVVCCSTEVSSEFVFNPLHYLPYSFTIFLLINNYVNIEITITLKGTNENIHWCTKQVQSLSQLKVKHEIAVQSSLSHYEP